MDQCISTSSNISKKRNENLDIILRRLNREQRQSNTHTILLLGPNSSGKTTIFKALNLIQNNGTHSSEELTHYIPLIHDYCISQMRILISIAFKVGYLDKLSESSRNQIYDNAKLFLKMTSESENEDDSSNSFCWSRDVGEMIILFWSDPVMKQIFERDRTLSPSLNENAYYFFDSCPRFLEDDFCPTEDDVMRVRVRKMNGIKEEIFLINENMFKFIDISGQRSERRKWLHCFSEVSVIIFMVSLNDYDSSREDDIKNLQINYLEEALELFEEVANSPYFTHKDIILFLNKTDLFREKLKKVRLSDFFQKYDGENIEDATLFIGDMFRERVRNEYNSVYLFSTCAIDSEHIYMVFQAVFDLVTHKMLSKAG